MSKSFFDSAIKGNAQLWNEVKTAYGDDLENFTTIAEGKQRVDAHLRSQIGTAWASLYNSQAVTMEDMIEAADTLNEAIKPDGEKMSTDDFMDAMRSTSVLNQAGISDEEVAKQSDKVRLMKTSLKKIQEIANEAARKAKEITSSLGTSSSGSGDKNAEKYKNEKDDLASYEIALKRVTEAIALNEAEQNKAKSFAERLKLMKEEVDLLKDKKFAIDNIARKERELAEETRKRLEEKKLTFKKDGAYDEKKYNEIVDSMVATIDSTTDEKNKDSKVQELTNFKDWAAKYISLYDKYYSDITNVARTEVDIINQIKDVEKAKTD
jgi:hypothetical protein